MSSSWIGGSDADKRAWAIKTCRAQALEAENPETSLSALADLAKAVAERLVEVDYGGSRGQKFDFIEGGRLHNDYAATPPHVTVIESRVSHQQRSRGE